MMKTLSLLALAAFSLFIAVNPLSAQGLTFTTNNYTVGSHPYGVVAVDLHGNRKPDLICANDTDKTLILLTNDGTGILSSNSAIKLSINPDYLQAADVNGDGYVDLIPASTSTSFPIYTNNNNGALGLSATLKVGQGQNSVEVADVNGDGYMDLIACYNNNLMVFTNNGLGIYGSNATYTVGSGPNYVLIKDINGDGKPDLITPNQGGNSLTILTNNGFGIFGSNATLRVGVFPTYVVSMDVNGDEKPDLICCNCGGWPNGTGTTLSVLTNNGYDFFGSNATLTVGLGPVWIDAVDINGDGRLDLVTANSSTNTLTVLTNNGSGGFGYNTTLHVGGKPYCVVAADLNGDGKMDLISANGSTNNITVLLNTYAFSPATNAPALTMNLQGKNTRVTWPLDSPGWSLQQNSNLTQPAWIPSGYDGNMITDDGTNESLTLPPLTGEMFFRLIHP